MEGPNIRYSEMSSPPLVSISTNSYVPVDHATSFIREFRSNVYRSSKDLDNHIKGLIKCESCSKTFTTRGGYKFVSIFPLESSFEVTASILAAIAKLIPGHTVATPVAKGSD